MPPRSQSFRTPADIRGATLSLVCALVLPWALAVASCTSRANRRAAAPRPAPAVAQGPVETRIGVVRAIGADQRFVLIETPSALATSALSEGQLLHCRLPTADDHSAMADLRVSRERHQALIVANVAAGEPAVGAIVYSTTASTPAFTPSPDSISSISTAPLPGLFATPKP